ncbi:MAG: DUF2634 domain-containing protein [Bacteroidales bacterium]|jgi:hypothetical protein|nr:DUF2634 domain-containing protein [Bacteroidales bacterium]
MTPSSKIPVIVRAKSPSTTWLLENGRLVKRVDALAAMMQAVRKLFATERYTQSIYTGNYGVELESLIGKSSPFVLAVMEQRMREALLQDDRISDVKLKQVQTSENSENIDSLVFELEVYTNEGVFRESVSVGI